MRGWRALAQTYGSEVKVFRAEGAEEI